MPRQVAVCRQMQFWLFGAVRRGEMHLVGDFSFRRREWFALPSTPAARHHRRLPAPASAFVRAGKFHLKARLWIASKIASEKNLASNCVQNCAV